MSLVDVAREHIPEEMLGDGLTFTNLEEPLIGFKEIKNVVEVADAFSEGISRTNLSKYNKEAFLTIALFDIWLSNDDRNINNTNILVRLEKNVFQPIAIDHEKIFNTGSLTLDIYELSYEDSMLYSSLYHLLFKSYKSSAPLIDKICASLYPNSEICNEQLDAILADVPVEWGIDTSELQDRLQRNIFSASWLAKVDSTFKEFASLTLKNP